MITGVVSANSSLQAAAVSPQVSLEAIAKQHNVSVPELIKGAQAAGSEGLPYQIRTLNLVRRLEE